MKQVVFLLLLAMMLNGCSGSTPAAQVSSAATWQAALSGGEGAASGLSFNTQFTINSNGSLNFSSFQLLNYNSSTSCFAQSGEALSGAITNFNVNINTDQVTGDVSITVQDNSNTLTLTGTLTGTESGTVVGTNNTGTFTSATVTGSWTLTGGTGCTGTDGSFTMTLNPSTS